MAISRLHCLSSSFSFQPNPLLAVVSFEARLKRFFTKILYTNSCKFKFRFKEFLVRLLDQHDSPREKKTKTARACFLLALFSTVLKLAFKIAMVLALKQLMSLSCYSRPLGYSGARSRGR